MAGNYLACWLIFIRIIANTQIYITFSSFYIYIKDIIVFYLNNNSSLHIPVSEADIMFAELIGHAAANVECTVRAETGRASNMPIS